MLALGNCLDILPFLPSDSVDMVLTDPPYGTTACKWDSVIPFEPMWKELKRVVKKDGAIVFTASQPFTSALVMSNASDFRYQRYWAKTRATGFANAKKQPLRDIEDVLVFCRGKLRYYPQGLEPLGKVMKNSKSCGGDSLRENTLSSQGKGRLRTSGASYTQEFTNYPTQSLVYPHDTSAAHPTQKPVALLEYLIKTYTLEGETVLDFTMGSGSTGVAFKNLNRKFIGIELDTAYFEIARKRIADVSPAFA